MTAHPAKFSDAILRLVAGLIPPGALVLDPYAGTGRVHSVAHARTFGVEIEPEWASMHPDTVVGDALQLPFGSEVFDVVVTSPCLAQQHRVLTSDLRWIPVGDVQEGQEVMAFDEYGHLGHGGTTARRRWQRSTVVRSVPRWSETVRVWLANGECLTTTPEHPWLACKKPKERATWVPSRDLEGMYVHRQTDTWTPRSSYEAGWLAGMFDGEGCLSLGVHGAPKMTLCQVNGPVQDTAAALMEKFGYNPNRIARRRQPETHQPIANLYVTGGFPGLMRALGELRPQRLLAKWETLDVSTRTVQAELVKVEAVESAGCQDIQEIETTTGTYLGEGYLHHNCYGNRFADSHTAKDGSRRHSYTHTLRRATGDESRRLHPNNSGTLHWGARYREHHVLAWGEVQRVLKPGGWFILNTSNHVRSRQVQRVTEWHHEVLAAMGFEREILCQVSTPRLRDGENADARVDFETVARFIR